eukprot:365647-Chlamydomonas_euryale.AAC.15
MVSMVKSMSREAQKWESRRLRIPAVPGTSLLPRACVRASWRGLLPTTGSDRAKPNKRVGVIRSTDADAPLQRPHPPASEREDPKKHVTAQNPSAYFPHTHVPACADYWCPAQGPRVTAHGSQPTARSSQLTELTAQRPPSTRAAGPRRH